jgi:imidazolonepropionase-like amidohydrolase
VVRAGVTGIFDADCLWETGIELRDAIEAGIVDGPRMTAGGNALLTSVGGTAGRLIADEGRTGYARVVRSRDEMVAEVRQQVKNGVDWIKVHVTGLVPRHLAKGELQVWSYDELRTVCDLAHELETPVVGHCRNAKSVRDSVRAGMDMILHATYMDEEALEHVIEAKTALVPTLTFQANLADYGEKIGASPELIDIFKREIAESSTMLRRAYEAGVPFLTGSESGFALTPYGEWHHRELEVFVEHLGMSPLEAIICGTKNGAFALGLDGRTGTLAPGMLADFIIVNGEPDRDVSVLGRRDAIEAVYIGGRHVDTSVPDLPRKPIKDWRVSGYAKTILTRDVAGLGKNGIGGKE